ncbi:MAG: WVD2 family protein [Calditrichia bacterium]|nr:WVD2 family protein [Calditrichia bacterium]
MRKLVLLLFILLTCTLAYSQNPGTTGSFGFFHTHEGRTLMPGRWDFGANLNFWTKLGEYLGEAPPDFSAANYWLVAGNVSASYGIINNLDATLALRVYQDTHHQENNKPGDLFLTIKGGSFNFERGHFTGALWTTLRFPTGKVHNYPLAEYASGAVEYGFSGGISYYYNPYLPGQGIGLHFNLGWWNHNEKGSEVDIVDGTTRTATVNSQELKMNLAIGIPTGLFQFRMEMFGGIYTTIPDPFVYSAEDYAFLTPSIRYSPYNWMSVDLGVDIRISPDDRQRTTGVPDFSNVLDLPKNYPPWKAQLGVQFSLLPAGVREQYGGAADNIQIRRRLNFYEKVMEEKAKAAKLEKEIEELRKVRENADLEIEKLREELE